MRTTFLLFFLFFTAIAYCGIKERKPLPFHSSEIFNQEISIPNKQLVPVNENITASPNEGIVIGTTDYDYLWSGGFTRLIATYDNGKEVHMLWRERNVESSGAPKAGYVRYTYFNSNSQNNLTQGYLQPRQNGSQLGCIDVIPAGAGAGIPVIVYNSGGNNYLAIDAAPGACQFTEKNLPSELSTNIISPKISVSPDGETFWFTGKRKSSTYVIAKSTDYGSTWIGIDSLNRFLPNTVLSASSEATPMLIAPNGTLYYVASFQGKGAIPPLGNAHIDSADVIGYFKSVDNGKTWSWNPLIRDGEKLIIGNDTVFALTQNFSQYSAVTDKNSFLHVVTNGYCVKKFEDGTYSNYFYTLYSNTKLNCWYPLSLNNDAHIEDFDNEYPYPGNAFGFPYPTITVSKTNELAKVFWLQPIVKNGKLVLDSGFVQFKLYSRLLFDGVPFDLKEVQNSYSYTFPSVAPTLIGDVGNTSADLLVLIDSASGSSVFGQGQTIQNAIVYRRISNDVIVEGPFISSACNGYGSITPKGIVGVSYGGTVKFEIKPFEGYKIDSVVVDNKNIGTISEYVFSNVNGNHSIYAFFSKIPVSVIDEKNRIPNKYQLLQNYPNPFNPTTVILYELPNRSFVELKIFDLLGKEIAVIVNDEKEAGRYSAKFDGAKLSAGMYFYTLKANNFVKTQKMLLVK